MTNEYEYSQQIKYFDWPPEWRLDEDDEDQLDRNIREAKEILNYLERKKEIGIKGNFTQIKKPKPNV